MPTSRARHAGASAPLAPLASSAAALADRWHSLAIHLLRALRREDQHSGLTAPRASALSVLVFGGAATLGELAAAEQVRPPTMTRLVRALEREGLVRREPVASDRRVVRLRATPRGAALLVAARKRRVRKLARPLAGVSAADAAVLASAAEILSRVVRALAEPAPAPRQSNGRKRSRDDAGGRGQLSYRPKTR